MPSRPQRPGQPSQPHRRPAAWTVEIHRLQPVENSLGSFPTGSASIHSAVQAPGSVVGPGHHGVGCCCDSTSRGSMQQRGRGGAGRERLLDKHLRSGGIAVAQFPMGHPQRALGTPTASRRSFSQRSFVVFMMWICVAASAAHDESFANEPHRPRRSHWAQRTASHALPASAARHRVAVDSDACAGAASTAACAGAPVLPRCVTVISLAPRSS